MTAVVTTGHSYSSGSTVNAANLHQAVESATIAGIDRANIDLSKACPFTFSSSEPSSPVDKELWQNSVTMAILSWNASRSRWIPVFTNMAVQSVYPDATAVTAGQALKATSGGVAPADGGVAGINVVGIAAHGVAAGTSKNVVYTMHGVCKAVVSGSVSAGDVLRLSATTGSLESAGADGQGVGAVAIALSESSGGMAWIKLKR